MVRWETEKRHSPEASRLASLVVYNSKQETLSQGREKVSTIYIHTNIRRYTHSHIHTKTYTHSYTHLNMYIIYPYA